VSYEQPGEAPLAADPAPAPRPATRGTAYIKREQWRKRTRLFNLIFLGTPLILAALYLYLFASDMYEVDTVLMVRSPGATSSSSSGGAMGGIISSMSGGGATSMERAVDESYAVVSYVQSRECFNELDKALNFTKGFQNDDIDWLNRLASDADHERRYQYYLDQIKIYYDDVEGQVILDTYGFTDSMTYNMAKLLVERSEQVVNQFNDRARTDLIRVAREQVEQAHKELIATGDVITAFQLKNSLLDPTMESSSFNTIITGLREQAASKRAEISSLLDVAKPETARMTELNNMRGALDKQILEEQQRLTGESNALAPLINQYRLLTIDQQLAQQKFSSAVGMLQAALLQAEQQKLYVVQVVPARMPEQPILPKRWKVMLIVLAATLVAWVIARLVLAAIRDHRV
jgi:capsular polysaccharide transport system permease protein